MQWQTPQPRDIGSGRSWSPAEGQFNAPLLAQTGSERVCGGEAFTSLILSGHFLSLKTTSLFCSIILCIYNIYQQYTIDQAQNERRIYISHNFCLWENDLWKVEERIWKHSHVEFMGQATCPWVSLSWKIIKMWDSKADPLQYLLSTNKELIVQCLEYSPEWRWDGIGTPDWRLCRVIFLVKPNILEISSPKTYTGASPDLCFYQGPFSVIVQLLSRVGHFVTPWTAVHQVSLSFTVS